MTKIFIVVAAYNAEKTIPVVLNDLKKNGYRNIVVVDDGSKDRTGKIAREKGAVVLTHVINRGQGAALRTGNEYALRNGADIIVHFDADAQMMAEDIPSMIEPIETLAEDIPDMVKPIENRQVDITIGSRFLGKEAENMPKSKKFTLFLGNLFLRTFYGVKLSDSQCGFRAMSRKAAQEIIIKEDRAEHASEILIEVFKKKLRYKEVPVKIKYTEYSKKHTQHGRIPLFSGIKIALRLIFKRLMQ